MLIQRVLRVIMPWMPANLPVYREIRQDPKATSEAYTIVGAAAVAIFLGAFLGGLIGGSFLYAILAAVIGAIFYVVGWLIFVLAAQLMASKAFGAQITFQEFLRPLGYVQAPAILNLLSFIPVLGAIITWLAGIYCLVLSFFAVRESTGLDTTKSILTVIVAWVAQVVVGMIIPGAIMGAIFAAIILSAWRAIP